MLSYAAALDVLLSAIEPLPPQVLAPAQLPGGVIAQTVRSTVAVPSFANAAMDGFALRSADFHHATPGAAVRLVVAGSIAAGQAAPRTTPPGSAWEIMTGAPMPADCDAVVPVERAQVTDGKPPAVLISEAPRPGQNRRAAGEDFARGDLLLDAGDALTPVAAMALAAVGVDSVSARPAPRIAVITTGSELASSGLPDAESRIRDVNGPYLDAALATLQLPLAGRRHVSDDEAALVEAITALAPTCDLIITTGGVSAGKLDFVPATLQRLAARTLFHKAAIRPGKPVLGARLDRGPLLIGLPGNPMAVAVGLRFFVLPAVRALMGRAQEAFIPARTQEPVRARSAMTFFAKAQARVTTDATLVVTLLPGQESFRISPLLRANCWAIVPAGATDIGAGEILEVAPLWPTDCPAIA